MGIHYINNDLVNLLPYMRKNHGLKTNYIILMETEGPITSFHWLTNIHDISINLFNIIVNIVIPYSSKNLCIITY